MIKAIRETRGLTQSELSKLSGVPQGVISYIESGKTRTPRIDTLQAVAKALGCSIEELLEKRRCS